MTNEAFYAIFLSLTAALSGTLAVITWQRGRKLPSGPPLTVLCLALCWWSGLYALFWLNIPAPYPTFWVDSTFIGVEVVPPAALLFALCYINPERRISRLMLAALAVEPLLTLLIMYSDAGDGLFFAGTHTRAGSAVQMGGPVFWLNVLYSYILLVAFFVLLLREFFRGHGLYRHQTAIFLLGVVAPWLTNAFGLAGLNILPGIDLTPIAFTCTGACLAYGLLRYGLLDVVPVARSVLVENMSDGVMVLDAKNRIVDANSAFCKLAGARPEQLIGRQPVLALAGWPDIVARYRGVIEAQDEVLLDGEPQRCVDVRIVPLFERGLLSGRLVVVRDVSERKRTETALRQANTRLQEQLGEITRLQEQLREQVMRDALTGLFNRRYLEETLERELTATARAGQPLSLVVIDVDLFKTINDTGGHASGDRMLQELSKLLLAHTRGSDVVSRYGGEEFVILLPGATIEQAQRRAEEWRALFEQLFVTCDGLRLHTTLSAGIAGYPAHGATGPDLLRAADEALYSAKHTGRNRVEVFTRAEPLAIPTNLPALLAAN